MALIGKFLGLLKSIWRDPAQEFSCGDCTRNAKCGQAPSNTCLIRLVQSSEMQPRPRGPSALGW